MAVSFGRGRGAIERKKSTLRPGLALGGAQIA